MHSGAYTFVTGATKNENPKHYTYCKLSVSLGHSANFISFYLQMMITQEFFHVFEMWIGVNEFDHHILVLLKQQRERPFSAV